MNRSVCDGKGPLKSVLECAFVMSYELLPAEGARVVFFGPLLKTVAMEGVPAVEVMHYRLYNR